MENKTNPSEKDTRVYTSDDEIPVKSPPRRLHPARDIKTDNSKTRIDLPTGEVKTNSKPTPIPTPKPKPKPQEPMYDDNPLLEEEEPMAKSILTMLGKGALYFVFVIAVSIIASYYIITMGNDVFAFVKDGNEVKIVIDEDDGIKEIASMLHDNGVIEYPGLFKLYNSFKNRGSEKKQEFVPDTYVFNADLNYDELIAKFEKSAPTRSIVDITFPEGLTVDQMIDIFLENGIGTREGFVSAVKSSLIYDMNYEFLTDLQAIEKEGFKDGRKYALEGYLYPDTYQFYTDTSEIDAVSKLLRTFNIRFEKEYYLRCDELNLSVDDVINIASIVQMETKYSSEYTTVSSLYHNRLNSPGSFPRLQCDSTYLYIYPDRRDVLTLDEMKESDNPYSTYSHDGLPPSAICNPSLDAIIAALYPSGADSSGNEHTYYYMVARPNGYHYFATSSAEHTANIARAQAEKGE